MNLSEYDGKYVCVKDIYGNTFSGRAKYGDDAFLECEFGGNEDGIFVLDYLIYKSQIQSIEAIEVHGTVELWTENLILRRYCPEDAEQLYRFFGLDAEMYKYSGWNPYVSLEMAQETVHRFIDSYDNEKFYSWVMDVDEIIVGTIGAYDYDHNQIEIGFSVNREWQGRGFATEAVNKVIAYLTENENIPCVTAWCAAENIGSRKVLEKAGMQHVSTQKAGLIVEGQVYDKLIYEYRR